MDRQGHVVLEGGERLLVVGGYSQQPQERCTHPLPLLELEPSGLIYRPQGLEGEPGLARWGHSATALDQGRVLILGGSAADPETSPWDALPSWVLDRRHHRLALEELPPHPSAFHQASLLQEGGVLLTGGAASHEETLARVALRDPQGHWSLVAPMQERRAGHSATVLADGRVLVVGGTRAGVDGESTRDCAADEDCARGTWCGQGWSCVSNALGAEVRDPHTGAWRRLRGEQGTRAGHSATRLPGGDVLVVGGRREGGALDSVWRYQAREGRWRRAAPLRQARLDHSALLLPQGQVWITGGQALVPCQQALSQEERELGLGCEGLRPVALASTELYDPKRDQWSAGPSLEVARCGHQMGRLEGRALIVGGQRAGQSVPKVEIFWMDAVVQP